MTKEQAIIIAKMFRQSADNLLQQMKAHRRVLIEELSGGDENSEVHEVSRHHQLSIHHLEDCIMRQGMVLKSIGTPTPYPNSYDPSNTIVEPTADGLKM
jgi:hypothetical protein